MITVGLRILYSNRETNMLHERETDLLRLTLTRVGHWYRIDAWGRTSVRGKWNPVWIGRVYISYLMALNEYNDTGAAMETFKNLLVKEG